MGCCAVLYLEAVYIVAEGIADIEEKSAEKPPRHKIKMRNTDLRSRSPEYAVG
jgi:hypothetical protein